MSGLYVKVIQLLILKCLLQRQESFGIFLQDRNAGEHLFFALFHYLA